MTDSVYALAASAARVPAPLAPYVCVHPVHYFTPVTFVSLHLCFLCMPVALILVPIPDLLTVRVLCVCLTI